MALSARLSSECSLTSHESKNFLLTEAVYCQWGLRVVIPEKYRVCPLDDLHQEHHGICRLKSLARGYFWWPGLDAAIVERV